MKTLITSLILALSLLVAPSPSYADTEEVLRAVQVLDVEDSRSYFHGQVFLLAINRPKDLIVVVETPDGKEITRTRCLLKKTAPRTFRCETDDVRASVRRKRGNGDILNVVARNYAAVITAPPGLELTTKVIVNYRVAEYTDSWHSHGDSLINLYRKQD